MGMKARGVVLAVAVWLMVVAGASALAWVVIDNAGRVAVSTATGSGNAVPTATATGTAPSRPPTATPRPPQVTPQVQDDRSTEVVGGHVGVRCVGGRIALRYAQPEDGWSVEVGSSGPVEVEVTFKRTGAAGGQTQSTAKCQRGTPTFSQESDSDEQSSDR